MHGHHPSFTTAMQWVSWACQGPCDQWIGKWLSPQSGCPGFPGWKSDSQLRFECLSQLHFPFRGINHVPPASLLSSWQPKSQKCCQKGCHQHAPCNEHHSRRRNVTSSTTLPECCFLQFFGRAWMSLVIQFNPPPGNNLQCTTRSTPGTQTKLILLCWLFQLTKPNRCEIGVAPNQASATMHLHGI